MSWKHTAVLESSNVQTAHNSLKQKVGDNPEKQITPLLQLEAPFSTAPADASFALFPCRLEKQTPLCKNPWQTEIPCQC